MDLSKDVEPVTALKGSAADLIARATDRHSPIVITQNGKPTAVLQDAHSYQRQQRALHLLKLLAQGNRTTARGACTTRYRSMTSSAPAWPSVAGPATMPLRTRVLPELQAEGIDGYREVLVGPYRLMFAVRRGEVVLLTVLDSRRDLGELLIARALRERA